MDGLPILVASFLSIFWYRDEKINTSRTFLLFNLLETVIRKFYHFKDIATPRDCYPLTSKATILEKIDQQQADPEYGSSVIVDVQMLKLQLPRYRDWQWVSCRRFLFQFFGIIIRKFCHFWDITMPPANAPANGFSGNSDLQQADPECAHPIV